MVDFFPVDSHPVVVLHHLKNTWDFSSIPHNMGNSSQTHQIEKTWEISNHNFPKV